MIRHALTGLTAAGMLVACGGTDEPAVEDTAGPELERERAERAQTSERPVARSNEPKRTAWVNEAARGTPLPLAQPASSALFHAAYQRVEDDWAPVIHLCDGIDGDRVKLVTTPDAKGLSRLWTYRKTDFRTRSKIVRLGDEDAGAGRITRELERADGSSFGAVGSINPGTLGDASATSLPTLSRITDGEETTRCRWLPRGRVLFTDARRSMIVTAEGDGTYTYRSFDHAKPGAVVEAGEGGTSSTPTLTVTGGRLAHSEPGRETYEFSNGPWTYRLGASADNRAPGATLTVLRDGRAVTKSVAAAYQMAARRIE